MWFGRFGYAMPVLAIAGGLVGQAEAGAHRRHPADPRPLFVGLLIGVILILGGLQYFPAQALGPIVEHFQMLDASPSH